MSLPKAEPIPPDSVRWNDFHNLFSALYPNTIRDVLDNLTPAQVLHSGRTFIIWPRAKGNDFDIYGPAFLEIR